MIEENWNIIYDIGKYWLEYLSGDLIEIGMGQSTYVFIRLGNEFDRTVYHCDIANHNFTLSSKGKFYNCTSDDFFRHVSFTPIAIGFIDADHSYVQAKKDFVNLFSLLQDNGLIFMHDTLPPNEESLAPHMSNDSYKLRQELEINKDVDVFTFPFMGYPGGYGITMIRKKPSNRPYYMV